MRFRDVSLKTQITGGFLLPVVMMIGVAVSVLVLRRTVETHALPAKKSAVFAGSARQTRLDAFFSVQ